MNALLVSLIATIWLFWMVFAIFWVTSLDPLEIKIGLGLMFLWVFLTVFALLEAGGL